MAFFQKDPDVQAQSAAESALRSKRRDRESLTERLGIAEAAITSYRAKARELARDGGDDKAISAAEGKMRDAQDRVVTLSGAIVDVDKTMGELAREIEQIIDKRCRVETSGAVTTMAERLVEAQAAHQAAALALEEAAKTAGILVPEAQAAHQFVISAREQLISANKTIVDALKRHAHGVLSDHCPASLPRPAAKPVELKVVPQEPMANVFVTRNIRYVAQGGDVICCGRNRRHDLPARIAELALTANAAVPLSDRKRIDAFDGTSGQLEPTPSSCEWIGPKGRESPPPQMRPGGPPPIHSSLTTFTEYDRGPSYLATFTKPAEPMPEPLAKTGTRSTDEE